MQRSSLLARIVALAIIAAGVQPCPSAEVRRVGGTELVLEGPIRLGDYDKLVRFVSTEHVTSIFLASPGGYLEEALKIGRLVRQLKIATVIPVRGTTEIQKAQAFDEHVKELDNLVCASACFFVYIAGIDREIWRPADHSNIPPALGIHTPFIEEGNLKMLSADQALSSDVEIRNVVDGYLREMSVPSKYANLIFSVPKDELQWISSTDFRSDLKGYVKQFSDWLFALCDTTTKSEKSRFHTLADLVPSNRKHTEELEFAQLERKSEDIGDCMGAKASALVSEAGSIFRRSLAERGDANAEYGYGESLLRPNVFFHVRDTGGAHESALNANPQLLREGITWLTKAGDQCHEYAQNELATLYSFYLEDGKDYVQAMKWLIIMNRFHKSGIDHVKLFGISPHMTPKEIDEAEKLANEWKPIFSELDPLATCEAYAAPTPDE